MNWNCPQCGNEVESSTTACPFCSYTKLPAGISLVSDETGKEILCRINTVFGSNSLKVLGDSGLKYVSSEQFSIEKNASLGGWFAGGVSHAKNPTYLNGAPLSVGGSLLKTGDKLSIKGLFLHISVRIDY
jgi:hypothetical protein